MRLTFPYTVSLLSDDQYRLSFRGYDVAVVEPTVGEALDVDGACGGYNLHWAFASGLRAGRSAARD